MMKSTSIVTLSFIVISILCSCSMFPPPCYSDPAKARYLEADSLYKKLRNDKKKQQYRENWMKCINLYQEVFTETPASSWAPAGMYASASLYLEMHKISYRSQDMQEGIDLLQRIIKRYPDSAYSKKAVNRLQSLSAPVVSSTVAPSPLPGKHNVQKSDTEPPENNSEPETGNPAAADPAPSFSGTTLVTGLRYWSNPKYTRVVIDAAEERAFTHHLLKKDPSLNKPQRLYVDIEKTRLGGDVPKHTEINDNLLAQARAGQFDQQTVRVVVDIKSFETYKIFSLKDPFRLVIDVWGNAGELPAPSGSGGSEMVRISTDHLQSSSIARQLALGVRTIVVDPGHGGKDPGAPGYTKKVWEKDISLKLATNLAKRMRDRLQCNVILTRSTDTYLTLEERTAIANTKSADLFVSLHCNASKNRKLTGVETYYLNLATDDQSIMVAARENATSRKNISDLESILNDLMKNAKINESSRLATMVQESMVSGLQKHYSGVNNLGVKQAPFYVLLGASMPSILVETSFLSNKTECRRLTDEGYQNRLCDSIIDGIEKYIDETNPKTL